MGCDVEKSLTSHSSAKVESVPYRRVGNQRRIRVADIRKFRERRETAEAGLRQMAVITESL